MDKYELKPWQQLALGGVIAEGGNSADYNTGSWRTYKPVWNKDLCIHCLTCWVFCPEDAFFLTDNLKKEGKVKKNISGINYYHCKGCGLCAKECPVNKKEKVFAIKIVKESK